MPFDVVLHPHFKIHGHGKTGSEINGNPAFKANLTLPTPLMTKRDAYSDIRDLFTDEMTFATYENDGKNDKFYGFIDVTTPLSGFNVGGNKQRISHSTITELKKIRR